MKPLAKDREAKDRKERVARKTILGKQDEALPYLVVSFAPCFA